MDEVAVCRRAAHDAVRDIEPERLRRVMDELLEDGSMTPGVVTLRAARAASAADGDGAVTVEVAGHSHADADHERVERGDGLVPPDHIAELAAGVQLIYEGLRLIRRLASEDPWTAIEDTPDDGDRTDENLAVLAADVLVSRGFYLLARTPAADKAVETVRNFGRDQTLARDVDERAGGGLDDDHEYNLEADVLQLALVAGTATAPGVTPTPGALSSVTELGRDGGPDGSFPPAATALSGTRVRAVSGASVGLDGDSATRTSATDS